MSAKKPPPSSLPPPARAEPIARIKPVAVTSGDRKPVTLPPPAKKPPPPSYLSSKSPKDEAPDSLASELIGRLEPEAHAPPSSLSAAGLFDDADGSRATAAFDARGFDAPAPAFTPTLRPPDP